jgi:hypothetical protein
MRFPLPNVLLAPFYVFDKKNKGLRRKLQRWQRGNIGFFDIHKAQPVNREKRHDLADFGVAKAATPKAWTRAGLSDRRLADPSRPFLTTKSDDSDACLGSLSDIRKLTSCFRFTLESRNRAASSLIPLIANKRHPTVLYVTSASNARQMWLESDQTRD